MKFKCVGCGLYWNVSVYQQIPRGGYICPHCESRLRAGETLSGQEILTILVDFWNTYNSPPFSLDCTKKFYKIKWGCLIMADVKQCDMCRNIFKKEEDAIIENMKINCIVFGRRNANENSYAAKKLFDLCPDCAESIYQIIQKWPEQLEKEREKE